MIIRIQASGGSFLGAGKYYLHDKLSGERAAAAEAGERVSMRGQSDDRVWFTDTRNCLCLDPERALEEMWRTADDQAYLKLQAGVKRGGRVCTDPVKTISLSWHKDDQPDPQHMVEQADSFLKHMGWEKHQAVYVGHNDTEHRHIHIVLNRVNPETGRTLDDYQEKKRAQVWALAYEKVQENVRCEERERRAAMREQRPPELNDGKAPADDLAQNKLMPLTTRSPANDHLPHNVVMLSRPLEREFAADEQARAAVDDLERHQLKAHQRAEREEFFKDGAKLFKALRHATYDEVRKAYKAEWRQFYKDSKQAGFDGDFAKDHAIKDAVVLAAAGRWQEARERFGTRDDTKLELAMQLADRKADIEQRQKAEIAILQREACNALRMVRDVQYQDLLQRQRNERAAWMAGTALETLGIGSMTPGNDLKPTALSANQNDGRTEPSTPFPSAPTAEPAPTPPQSVPQSGTERSVDESHATPLSKPLLPPGLTKVIGDNEGGYVHLPTVPTSDVKGPSIDRVADATAGAIGHVASYLADQLGELFAPTPPEIRESQAKAAAQRDHQREAERPAVDDNAAVYARIIGNAVKRIEADKASGKDDAYWKERDRGKGWERDQ